MSVSVSRLQAVARLLIILWEHELPVLKHAHGVSAEEDLCDELLQYTRDTLQVRRCSSPPSPEAQSGSTHQHMLPELPP